MNNFRTVLALCMIFVAGTLFAAPRGGGDGPTDSMRGAYSCYFYSDPGNRYSFDVNVQSATFIESNTFSNVVEMGQLFECAIHLDRIDLLASSYCETEYISNGSRILFICRGSREEMVGLLADMQTNALKP